VQASLGFLKPEVGKDQQLSDEHVMRCEGEKQSLLAAILPTLGGRESEGLTSIHKNTDIRRGESSGVCQSWDPVASEVLQPAHPSLL
jgi:hypothetical protein